MFFIYLRRELINRRRQSIIVSFGLAIGIALVATVSAISSGVRQSQDEVLNSLYGIGTDITITQRNSPREGSPRFEVRSGEGRQSGGVQSVSRTRLVTERGASTFNDQEIDGIKKTLGVSEISTALKLTNITFEGELPTFMARQSQQTEGNQLPRNTNTASSVPATPTTVQTPTGGADGRGGSAFTVTEFSVLGVSSSATEVGPMSSVMLSSGRFFTDSDADKYYAVIDSTYATTEGLKLNENIVIAEKKFTIVGIVSPSSGDAETAANSYIPIDVARSLANVTEGVTNVYVKATNNNAVKGTTDALSILLPDATISTSAELAETVSGSLSTASDLMSNMGRWLSFVVLLVAFLIAILFTLGGVARRTREFGTLKALGWKSNKIVRQVMAESIVQGSIGGLLGASMAFVGVSIVNAVAPTLEATSGGQILGDRLRGVNRPGGGNGLFGARGSSQSTFEVVLHAAITPQILLFAIGLAIAGGVLAGAAGGMRAARLHPAESLRSVA